MDTPFLAKFKLSADGLLMLQLKLVWATSLTCAIPLCSVSFTSNHCHSNLGRLQSSDALTTPIEVGILIIALSLYFVLHLPAGQMTRVHCTHPYILGWADTFCQGV